MKAPSGLLQGVAVVRGENAICLTLPVRVSPQEAEGCRFVEVAVQQEVSCMLENTFPCTVLSWFHPVPAG